MERHEVVKEAPSVEEALDEALEELGVQQDVVEYEVLEEPGRKMFGLGSDRPARVKVWLKPEAEAELRKAEAGPAEETESEAESGADKGDQPYGKTSEEIDRVADEASEVIREVLASFGIDADIDEYEGDENEVILDIVGDDLGVLIGRHGKTLDALQVLVAAMTNKRVGFRYPLLVDVSGYRYRRRAKLEEIASRAAERAAKQGQSVSMRPMSSYERRLIHMALRDDTRVTTESEGEEPNRHVVVLPR